MLPSMTEQRIRLVVLTDDEVRAALRLRAAKYDVEMSELASEILREALAEEIKEVRLNRAAQDKKKGRRPKDGGE